MESTRCTTTTREERAQRRALKRDNRYGNASAKVEEGARRGNIKEVEVASLWQLCKEGKLAGVREALARGEDVNSKDEKYNRTALMWAMKKRDTEVVKLLLEQPTVDLNCTDKTGNTALHIAAMLANAKGVKMLLADPRLTTHNHKSFHGSTPFMRAISASYTCRDAAVFRELVAHPSIDLDTKDICGKGLEEQSRNFPEGERIIREARQRRRARQVEAQQQQQEHFQVCMK